MLILYSVVLGILLGYIRGGRLTYLPKRPLRLQWIAILAFLIQILIFSDIPFFSSASDKVIVALHLISYACLLAFLVLNIRVPGIPIIGAGIFSNSLVIFLNGGYMPTYADNLKQTSMMEYANIIGQGGTANNSIGITNNTLLPWLGDIFYLPSWVPLSNVFSIGDVIIGIGICIYFMANMKPLLKSN